MRIACVHVPQFALQCLGRVDPSLRGAAVAVVGVGLEPAAGARPSLALHSPVVLACSRAAWTLGVRVGMTASAARFKSPELRLVTADRELERETVRALADALLGAAAVVDTGGRVGAGGAHLAMYCELPGGKGKLRGAAFGARLLELLDSVGVAARIGIADDRFTAWVAAAHSNEGPGLREDRGVVVVPRGGSAAFLAPRPLSLLSITPEVQHMLEALGVRTLGEFAALPAPSVARPLDADFQALARGDSGHALRPYAPEAPIREDLAVGSPGDLFGGAAAVATIAERLALRLAGRGRGAARLELTVSGAGADRVVPIAAASAAITRDELAELIAPQIDEGPGAAGRLRVVVVGEAIAGATDATEDTTEDASAAEAVSAIDSSLGAAAGVASHSTGALIALTGQGPGHLAWQLSAPQALRSERRDAHRRTRRARQRRRVELVQPQLFGQLDA